MLVVVFLIMAVICLILACVGGGIKLLGKESLNNETCDVLIILGLSFGIICGGLTVLFSDVQAVTKDAKTYETEAFTIKYDGGIVSDNEIDRTLKMLSMSAGNMTVTFTDALGRKHTHTENVYTNVSSITVGDENKVTYRILTDKPQTVLVNRVVITEDVAERLGYTEYAKSTTVSVGGGEE